MLSHWIPRNGKDGSCQLDLNQKTLHYLVNGKLNAKTGWRRWSSWDAWDQTEFSLLSETLWNTTWRRSLSKTSQPNCKKCMMNHNQIHQSSSCFLLVLIHLINWRNLLRSRTKGLNLFLLVKARVRKLKEYWLKVLTKVTGCFWPTATCLFHCYQSLNQSSIKSSSSIMTLISDYTYLQVLTLSSLFHCYKDRLR